MIAKEWISTTEENVSKTNTRIQSQHLEKVRHAEYKMRRRINSVQLDLCNSGTLHSFLAAHNPIEWSIDNLTNIVTLRDIGTYIICSLLTKVGSISEWIRSPHHKLKMKSVQSLPQVQRHVRWQGQLQTRSLLQPQSQLQTQTHLQTQPQPKTEQRTPQNTIAQAAYTHQYSLYLLPHSGFMLTWDRRGSKRTLEIQTSANTIVRKQEPKANANTNVHAKADRDTNALDNTKNFHK